MCGAWKKFPSDTSFLFRREQGESWRKKREKGRNWRSGKKNKSQGVDACMDGHVFVNSAPYLLFLSPSLHVLAWISVAFILLTDAPTCRPSLPFLSSISPVQPSLSSMDTRHMGLTFTYNYVCMSVHVRMPLYVCPCMHACMRSVGCVGYVLPSLWSTGVGPGGSECMLARTYTRPENVLNDRPCFVGQAVCLSLFVSTWVYVSGYSA